MSNQMITFSFRTTPEAVLALKKQARKKKVSCGAVLREILKEISVKEETHESESHKNDRPGNDVGNGGGL